MRGVRRFQGCIPDDAGAEHDPRLRLAGHGIPGAGLWSPLASAQLGLRGRAQSAWCGGESHGAFPAAALPGDDEEVSGELP